MRFKCTDGGRSRSMRWFTKGCIGRLASAEGASSLRICEGRMWWIRRSMMATGRWLPTRRAKPKRWSGATLLPETWPMQRSEVWWVEFDPGVGREMRRTRPAVIVSNSAANRNLARVVVVPLSSNTGRQYPGETVVTVGGQSSKAMADQIMAADKARLKNQIGTLSKADMLAVEDAIKVHLALPR